MPCLCCGDLVSNTGHCPRRRIVRVIVGINSNIFAANIGGSNVIYDLLVILCHCVLNCLSDAGSQIGCGTGKYRIVVIFRDIRVNRIHRVDRVHGIGTAIIAGKTEQIVSEGIAAGFL